MRKIGGAAGKRPFAATGDTDPQCTGDDNPQLLSFSHPGLFHMIDLDPGFRIADEGELKLLRQDVLEEVLENCYTAGEQSFLDCIEVLQQEGMTRRSRRLFCSCMNFLEAIRSRKSGSVSV